jgi:hypothetical protein
MSVRGKVTIECDSKGCRAEQVIEADEQDLVGLRRGGIELTLFAADWVLDDDNLLRCPQCCEEGRERDEDDGKTYGHPGDAKADRL